MLNSILRTLLLGFGCLLLVACQHNDTEQVGTPLQGTSLTIAFCSSIDRMATRGVEDLNEDGNISEDEIVIDGRMMYRLGVFLADGSNVVASTVLEAGDGRFSNNNTEATVTFENLDYSKTYQLYAVANYGSYGSLTGNVTNITADNVTSAHSVTASSSNMCYGQTAYPLSLKKEIQLEPGSNTIAGELLRTYARIRINMRNQSAQKDITVTNLSFPAKFTQNNADLFDEGGVATVSPKSTSDDAITPFTANMVIPKIDDNGNVSETTIFDAYVLESTEGNYQYTIGLKYEGESSEVYTVSSTPVNSTIDIEDGAMYVIYSTNSGRYLYANGTSSVSSSSSYLTAGELNHNYVWRFKRTSGNMYTIESMGGSGYYMRSSGLTQNSVPLTYNPSSNDYFGAV